MVLYVITCIHMELLILWRAVYKKRFILAIVPVMAAALAYTLSSRFSKTYKSFTQLSTGFTLTESIDPDKQSLQYFQIDANFQNLRANIGSLAVIGALSYKLGLHDLDRSRQPFRVLDEKAKELERTLNKDVIRKVLAQKLDSLQVLDLSKEEDQHALELLKLYGYDPKSLERVLNIYRVESSDFLRIEAGTNNAQLSAFLVNGLYQEFERYNTQQFSMRASGKLAQLYALVASTKAISEEKALELRTLQRSSSTIDVEAEGAQSLGEIQKLQGDLREAQNQLTQDDLSLDEVNAKLAKLGNNTPSTNSNDRYYRLEERINSLRRQALAANKPATRRALEDSVEALIGEQARLRANVSVDNPTNKTGREEELLDEKSRLTVNVRAARNKIASLQAALSSEQGTKSVMSGKVSDFQKLKEEAEQALEDYLSIKQRYDKARENVQSFNNIQQVIIGQPALEAESSKRLIFTALGGIGSFVLVLAGIILLELLDSTLKSPSVFGKQIRARLLGAINFVNLDKLSPEMLFNEPLPVTGDSPQLKAPGQVPELPESLDVRIVTSGIGFFGNKSNSRPRNDKKPKWEGSVFKEAIRRVRYELIQSGKKVFLITSLRSEDGKSTLIQYLAYALGRAGLRVLIIDSNFENNTLTRWSPPRVWIEDLGADNGEIPIGGGFGSPSPYPRIDIVGCRGGVYTPSEILSPISMPAMVRYAREWYDVILMETADMATHTDAREMMVYAESAICVASAEHGVNQKDKDNVNYLNRLGDRFLGMVLNKVQSDNLPH